MTFGKSTTPVVFEVASNPWREYPARNLALSLAQCTACEATLLLPRNAAIIARP
jgi:hypothetical protein